MSKTPSQLSLEDFFFLDDDVLPVALVEPIHSHLEKKYLKIQRYPFGARPLYGSFPQFLGPKGFGDTLSGNKAAHTPH